MEEHELRQRANLKDECLPFEAPEMNAVWVDKAMRCNLTLQELSLQDALEADPSSHQQAMCNVCFKDFWLEAEKAEWEGLWERQCFRKWKSSYLDPSDRVFGSRYHYKIKHNNQTGCIACFKVRLVVQSQGHKMKEGEDFNLLCSCPALYLGANNHLDSNSRGSGVAWGCQASLKPLFRLTGFLRV